MSTDVPSRLPRPLDFAKAVLCAVTWRAVLLTQLVGGLFALTPWLEQWGRRGQPDLSFNLAQQAIMAAFLMLAAFAGDEAVRRGWTVPGAFVAALLCASGAVALTLWGIEHFLSLGHPGDGLGNPLNAFFEVGSLWGTVLLVYLNRQSAARLLASVRGGEMARLQAERSVIAADLAAVEAQIDPVSVSRQLEQVRDLYAAGNSDAEPRLEALITNLREKVSRCAQVT